MDINKENSKHYRHRWTMPLPFYAYCTACELRRRTVCWIASSRIPVYSMDGQTFTRKMPNCISKDGIKKRTKKIVPFLNMKTQQSGWTALKNLL